VDDTITTDPQNIDSGEEVTSSLEATVDTVAENDQEITQNDPVAIESDDPELDEYIARKNLDVSDPRKLAKIIRENDRKISEQGLKTSELSKQIKQVDTSDDYGSELPDPKMALLEFRVDHPDFKPESDLDTEMSRIITEAAPGVRRVLASDLNTVYRMAKANLADASVDDAEERGRMEERKALASKQRASAPTTSATTQVESERITPANVDALVAKNSTDWYRKHIDEINAAMR
jgi:hypothetical protein